MQRDLFHRRSLDIATESLSAFRAVVIQGARQVGKTTLAELIATQLEAPLVTLDREEDLSAAREDPSLRSEEHTSELQSH